MINQTSSVPYVGCINMKYLLLQENIGNLITVMCEITFDPGKFDTLCGPLVDSFAATLNDVNYTRPLVEAIVNQVRICLNI